MKKTKWKCPRKYSTFTDNNEQGGVTEIAATSKWLFPQTQPKLQQAKLLHSAGKFQSIKYISFMWGKHVAGINIW